MIVLANEEFATGLRLAGVKNSHIVTHKEHAEKILAELDPSEFIIATEKVTELIPKIKDYPNLIVFPDTLEDFSKVDDLKKITKMAIGSEVEI